MRAEGCGQRLPWLAAFGKRLNLFRSLNWNFPRPRMRCAAAARCVVLVGKAIEAFPISRLRKEFLE